MTPDELMDLAIERARAGIESGQSPFGCAVAMDGKPLAAAHNTVLASTDITAHAEINALRQACKAAGQVLLEGAIVATTCEPCPMCMAALHWSRAATVYYGASIDDADQAGFNELTLPAQRLLSEGGSTVQLVSGIQVEACRELFRVWLARPDRQSY